MIKEERPAPSEEEFLNIIDDTEDKKIELPKYLTAIYGKIYENPKVSKFFDNSRLLKFLTLGNSTRLTEALLKEHILVIRRDLADSLAPFRVVVEHACVHANVLRVFRHTCQKCFFQ